MTVPIVFIYAISIIFLILSFEENKSPINLIYPALAFFTGMMGYYLSYTNDEFVSLTYLPLAIVIISGLYLIYIIYTYLASYMSTDEDGEDYEQKRGVINE